MIDIKKDEEAQELMKRFPKTMQRFADFIEQEAKKEISNDIKKGIIKMEKQGHILPRRNILFMIDNIEKRHLSTFPKEKRHNNDFKKHYPNCNGTGKNKGTKKWLI